MSFILSLNNRLAQTIGSRFHSKAGKAFGITLHYILLVALFYLLAKGIANSYTLPPVTDYLVSVALFALLVLIVPAVAVVLAAKEYQLPQKHVATVLMLLITGFISKNFVIKMVKYGADDFSLLTSGLLAAVLVWGIFSIQTESEK